VFGTIKCLATRVKCSAQIRHSSGREARVDWKDAVVDDPESEYIETVTFKLTLTNLALSDTPLPFVGFSEVKRPTSQ
jgi:hypothetical protein